MALLSKVMQDMLRQAPNDWQRVSPGPTVCALEKRGLVILRDDPDKSEGIMRGFQWRITATGRVMDARDTFDSRGRVIMTGN